MALEDPHRLRAIPPRVSDESRSRGGRNNDHARQQSEHRATEQSARTHMHVCAGGTEGTGRHAACCHGNRGWWECDGADVLETIVVMLAWTSACKRMAVMAQCTQSCVVMVSTREAGKDADGVNITMQEKNGTDASIHVGEGTHATRRVTSPCK